MELNIGNSQFSYIDESKPSTLDAVYDSVATATLNGDVTDGAILDYGYIGMDHVCIVQEHGGVIVEILQCIGQSGAGDGSIPASGVVYTGVKVDMERGIGYYTTHQTDQLQQHQKGYLQMVEDREGVGLWR